MLKKAPVILLTVLILCLISAACGKDKNTDVVLKSANIENKDNSFDTIKELGTIRVAVNPDDTPYVTENGDGSYTGFLIDVISSAAELYGLDTEYVEIGDNSVISMITDGTADVILNGYSAADTSNKSVSWLNPYMKNHHIIVCRKSSGINSKKDLDGKKIGVAADTLPEITAQSDIKIDNDSLIKYDTENNALRAIADSEIDALIIEDTAFYSNDSIYKGGYKILDEIISTHVHSLGVKKENSQLAKALNDALAELSSQGKLGEMSEKWFGVDLTK